jgi:sugar phosphate isomerase/epimerase
VLALDTDSLAPDHAGPAAVAAGAALGFRALTLGARLVPGDPDPLVTALRREKLRVPAIHGPELELPGDKHVPAASLLASADVERRGPAMARLKSAAALALRLSARTLVLDLGALPLIPDAPGLEPARRLETSRDRALDFALPGLFELARRCPDVSLAVSVPERTTGWPDPETLEILVSELRGRRVGWWYDTARAHRYAAATGVAPECWLDRGAADLRGVTLADTGGEEDGLPLGAGEVDFTALRGLGGTDTIASVFVDPAFGPGALREAAAFLRGLGIGG